MKIPKRLKIGAVTYAVEKMPVQLENEKFGDSNREDQTIRLSSRLQDDQQEVIFWHEVVHQVLDAGMFFSHSHDEILVQHLAGSIAQVLRDNKLLRT